MKLIEIQKVDKLYFDELVKSHKHIFT